MKYLNLVTSLLAAVLLNGCLEVEDNDNSEIQTLIDNQTQTITESRQISIKGVVVDALDQKPMASALITVKVGSEEIISDFIVTNGEFELTGLPSYSDIDIIISSPDNKFLPRTFFTETSYASSEGISDFGNFAVSEAVEVKISVIDNATSTAFAKLEFTGYSHSGTNSSAYKYQHTATFDEQAGVYTITLPKFIDTSISASLDFDRDGEVDYLPELQHYLNGRSLYLGSANKKDFSTIYINEVVATSALEIRLSLVDEAALPLLGATFFIEENIIDSAYDELTSQYVIATEIKNEVTIQLPAFTSDDVHYQSSAFTVSKLADGNLTISKNGSYYNCCFTIPHTEVIDFALAPQVILDSETPVKVVIASSVVDPIDSSFSVFYSQGIDVIAENVSLTNTYGFTVLKGSDDANDLILPGSTLLSGGTKVPVTFALSLNGTRLKVTPSSSLTVGESYKYEISSVMNKANQENSDVAYDELAFEVEASIDEVFEPTAIKIDNENYTTNGVAITATNTAGDSAIPINWRDTNYLYLPTSINSLQNLTLRQVSIIRDGISSVAVENYNIIVDGQINAMAVGVVTLANNEIVSNEGNSRTVIFNSAQAETQKVYRVRTYVYTADNTDAEKNSISFEYSYETKAGEVSTGNITIPVQ